MQEVLDATCSTLQADRDGEAWQSVLRLVSERALEALEGSVLLSCGAVLSCLAWADGPDVGTPPKSVDRAVPLIELSLLCSSGNIGWRPSLTADGG